MINSMAIKRRLRMTRVVLIPATAIVLVLPSAASASTLSEFVSVGYSRESAISFLQPFDSALGTFTSVEVTITGELTATVATDPNLVGPCRSRLR
jgi:hypothetical protein